MFEGLKSEMRRPATTVAVAIAVLGVVAGIATSLYFYYLSVRQGKVSYQVEQVQVFDQSSLGEKPAAVRPLYVVDEHGNKINDNIYAAKIKIWNSGNDEVKRENVRTPFKVTMSGSAQVVTIEIEYSTRDNVDGFNVKNDGAMEWSHFDSKEGFILRVVYAAKTYVPISIEGYAVDTAGPTDTKVDRATSENVILMIMLWASGLLLLVGLIYLGARLASAPKDQRLEVLKGALAAVLAVAAAAGPLGEVLAHVFGNWLSLNPNPPF